MPEDSGHAQEYLSPHVFSTIAFTWRCDTVHGRVGGLRQFEVNRHEPPDDFMSRSKLGTFAQPLGLFLSLSGFSARQYV
jgi:hypothetical protein